MINEESCIESYRAHCQQAVILLQLSGKKRPLRHSVSRKSLRKVTGSSANATRRKATVETSSNALRDRSCRSRWHRVAYTCQLTTLQTAKAEAAAVSNQYLSVRGKIPLRGVDTRGRNHAHVYRVATKMRHTFLYAL